MKGYEKPVITESQVMEQITAYSGTRLKCSKGRREFNPGADKCQRCNGSNYRFDGMTCSEGMPRK